MLLFAWSGPDKTFAGESRIELSRRAFGKVPEDQRAPMQAPPWPTEDRSLWLQFAEGPKPLPLATVGSTGVAFL